MTIDRFVAQNRQRWQKLEELLARIESQGPPSLGAEELRQFAALYRGVAADLAYARTYFTESKVTEFLNHLVGRAHPLLYGKRRQRLLQIANFFRRDLPQTFRDCRPSIITSAAIFLAVAAAAYFVSWQNPAIARSVLPPALIQAVDAGQMWTHDIYSLMPGNLLSARIATNNITVTFMLFAMGMTAGLGTTFMLGYNGLIVGCAAGLCRSAGLEGDFFSFIAAHGPLELLIFFIAGGAGYELALALVSPGQLRRRDALRLRGERATRLVLGGVPLLMVAGLVEGFVSGGAAWWPVGGYDLAKIVTGAALCAAVLAYLILVGRPSPVTVARGL